MRKMAALWIPLCFCFISLVTRGVYTLGNEAHDSHDLHGDDDHDHGEKHHGEDIFDELYKELNGTNDELTTDNLEKFFTKLHLKSCFPVKQDGCNTCFNITQLLSWYGVTAPINETQFYKLSPGLLYILSETFNNTERKSKDCASISQSKTLVSEVQNLFKTFQKKYGKYGNSEKETEESLEHLLEKINGTIGENLSHVEKCFDAHDILAKADTHHALKTQDELQVISSHILYQIFEQKCISGGEKKEHEHDELPEAGSFVESIFKEFGQNKSEMTRKEFAHFYEDIELGEMHVEGGHEEEGEGGGHDHDHKRRRRDTHEDDDEEGHAHEHNELNKCFTANEIMEIYSVHGDESVDQGTFQKMCPSLLYQLDKKTCVKKNEGSKRSIENDTWKAWVGMFISISVVSIGSLSGIIAAPISKKSWFPYLIMCLISLAVATLIGDAILHLFPHAMELHQHKPGESHGNPLFKFDSYLWKSIAFLMGLYIFFLFEILMHAFGGEHSHSHGVEKHVASSSTNNTSNVKGTLGMSEGASVLYNNQIKNNSILRPSGLHECSPTDTECSGDCPEAENKSECSSAQENTESETETIPPSSPTSTDLMLEKNGSREILVLSEEEKQKNKYHLNNGYHGDNNSDQNGSISRGVHDQHLETEENKPLSLAKLKSIAWMVLIGDAIHNFLDGIAIGVAFSETWPDGLHGGISTSIAILCHELPHELGDFAVLLNSGLSIKQALVMNFISSLTAFIGGIIGVSLGTQWAATNWIFAITAGLFVYIALVDMLPEILHSSSLKRHPWFCIMLTNIGLWCGFMIMIALGAWEEDIKSVLKQ
eukprot:TCONS_00064169-protein